MKTPGFAISCLLLAFFPTAFAQETIPQEAVPASEPPTDLFARDSYRIDSVVCPFKGEIDYEPGDIECGLLERWASALV
jgi:hypothetical protein